MMDDTLSTLKLLRLRRYIDEEIERLGRMANEPDIPMTEHLQGRIYALQSVKVLHLLTPDEAAQVEETAREMGLR